MTWQRYPLLRLFLALCSGILATNFFVLPRLVWCSLGVGSLLLVIGASTRSLFFSYRFRGLFGIGSLLLFFSLGICSSFLYLRQANLPSLPVFEETGVYRIQLTQAPVNKGYAWRVEAEVSRVDTFFSGTKALLYFRRDSNLKESPAYGDVYLYEGRFSALMPPQNPYEFDYKNYLNLRAVYVSASLSAGQIQRIKRDHTSLLARAIALRQYLLDKIESWQLPAEQQQVSKALLLGYRNEVEQDLLQAYAAVGAMHVLAVSGLHVGIVYLVLGKLLFFLRKPKALLLKSFLLVLFLWFYAMLTGLSPSVVRAATMFSFVALGSSFRRNTSIYNTLLASAVILLLIKPTYLFEVGFQLSYLAVFGIVWLQPKFEQLWRPRFFPLKLLWSIATVSVAAQIATFPLGLYYFHQFPGLFLLSNFIVIPLVSVLMYVGLTVLILSLFMPPHPFLIWLYSKLLWLMNSGVEWVEHLNIGLIQEISIGSLELLLLYLFIGFFFHFLFSKKASLLLVALSMGLGLQLYQLWEDHRLNHTKELTIYAIKRADALSFRQGNRLYFLVDTPLLMNENKLAFYVKHHWWATNVRNVMRISMSEVFQGAQLHKKGNLVQLPGFTVVKNPVAGSPAASLWYVDRFYEKLPETFPVHGIWLSTHLKVQDRQEWVEWSRERKVKLIDPLREGAWQYGF